MAINYWDLDDPTQTPAAGDASGLNLLVLNADNNLETFPIGSIPMKLTAGTTLPATMPAGNARILTATDGENTPGMYITLTANTWSKVVGSAAGGYTIGTTPPSNPQVGALHQLNADTSLTAIAGEYSIVGETNSTQYVNSAADPNDIRAFYNPVLNPPSLFARYRSGADISGFLGGQSGDDLLFIPTTGTTITFDLGQPPTNSANARQLNFTNMVSPPNTSPLGDGTQYTIAILYQSRTFKKNTVFRWNGTYWVRVLTPTEVAAVGFSQVLWATSAAFADGDLTATGTLDWTLASDAPSGVTDGANTKVTLPKIAPDLVMAWELQLFNASHTLVDQARGMWLSESPYLTRRLYVDSNTYAETTLTLVNGTTPTLTVTAENSDNGLTGHYLKLNALVMAPNVTYTPSVPPTKNGVHRRCIAELSGTTGSTAPGLSLITAAYTPQNANARIFVRTRIVASCVGNSDNDYSQVAIRVKRGTGNYKRIDEQADGYTAIAGERMWQYSDNTARVHYEEFELEPENNTDQITVNLSIYMKDGASVSSTTGRLNRWGTNRNLGPSYIEIYERMPGGTLTRTTITALDSA